MQHSSGTATEHCSLNALLQLRRVRLILCDIAAYNNSDYANHRAGWAYERRSCFGGVLEFLPHFGKTGVRLELLDVGLG